MDTNNQPVDPTALSLSRAIRNAEGGDYNNTSGDNGTSAGAYQWNNGKLPLKKGEIPANFKSGASQFGLDPNDFSQTNQDHVAYSQIKHDLDSGLTQSQVAAKWNSGLTHGWENHKGTTTINGKTINYDTPSYVAKVQKYYEGQQNDSSSQPTFGQASEKKGLTFDDIPQEPVAGSPSTTDSILGTDPKDSLYGKIINNNVTRGIESAGNFLTGGGTGELGDEIGKSLNYLGQTAKGIATGTNQNQFAEQPSMSKTVGGTAKTVVNAGLLAGVGALSGYSKVKALTAPEISYNIPMTMEKFGRLNNIEKLNTLGEALKTAGEGDKIIIAKAMEALKPNVGFLTKFLKSSTDLASKAALYKVFGDTIGGLIHGATKK